MSFVTSGLTVQLDFTNASSLVIGGGTGVAILKADNLANPPLFFSGIPGNYVQSDAQGWQNPTTLQFSGVALSQGGTGLTNKLGDYGTYTEYTTWFMWNNTGQTYSALFASDNPTNYSGQSNGTRWFQVDTLLPTSPFQYGARTYSFYTDNTSTNPEPNTGGLTIGWNIGATRVFQSGTSAVTEVWLSGVLVSQTVQVKTLRTFTDPIFQLLSFNTGVAMTEALFYDRRLSDSEMTDTYNYFLQKYYQAPPSITPSPTPTITNTPSVTPSLTPSNTPTPSITPSQPPPSPTPLPVYGINFKTIADDLKYLANHHKQINSFGLGNVDELSFLTTSRDKQPNPDAQSPYFPLMFVVPNNVINDLQFKEWKFNIVMLDIVERDLANEVDTLSDTLQMLNDVISQFRLSVTNQQGNFNYLYYLDDVTECTPFMEKYTDLNNGWTGLITVKTKTPLDRCAAAFNTFTGSPIYHAGINFKTIIDDFRLLADHHKQINSFGFGDSEEFGYLTDSRDKQPNPDNQSPYYPLMFVIPNKAFQELQYMTYEFNIIVADIVERDLDNMIDVLSDTNQILDDIISQFRLSVTDSLGNFNRDYYLDDSVTCIPFIEAYQDLLAGWTGTLRIKIMTPLDRCAAAFDDMAGPFPTQNPTPTPTNTPTTSNTPTPSVTPTNTNTPTQTGTPTATPTCPVTTQYLEVQIQNNAKFKLILWNQPNFTSPANANCNYIISGCAYGDLGTVYCGLEQIDSGQHQHQFDLAPVFLPGEDVVSFDVLSYTLSGCPCPVDLILPIGPTPTPTKTLTPTPTNTQTNTPTETVTQTPSETPTSTPTPSVTQTPSQTNTPTQTNTPSQTPSNSPTNTPTPSITPTFTPTPSSTPTIIPPDDCVWNTNNTLWNLDSNTWDSCSNPVWNTNTNQWENETEQWND